MVHCVLLVASAYMSMFAPSPRDVGIRFLIASAPVVEKVCEYMSFKAHYEGPGSKEDVPINEFTERIPPEIALELYVL